MKIHINYAHGRYTKSQELCSQSALNNGFDSAIKYGLKDIDREFLDKNSYTFSQARGVGYWIWKPYLILKTLESMTDSDWMMYTDSGMHFVRNPWPYILEHEQNFRDKGIVTFGLCGLNKQFTKRDAFVLMGSDNPKYTDAEQRTASVFVCRKTAFSVSFMKEWLSYACDPRIISDLPNTQGLPNYSVFKDHRHDQSIMSILAIKYDTYLMKDMTQFWMPDNPYIMHTRNPV